MTKKYIYIIPRPRTGGTLLAAVLNAHSSITMSYEIFPDLLMDGEKKGLEVNSLIRRLEPTANLDSKIALRELEKDDFRVFVARAHRSGLTILDLLSVLSKYRGKTFSSLDLRIDFINDIMKFQAQKEAVSVAGAKIRCSPFELYVKNPDAVFATMVRDGRDVFASRKLKGNFNMTVQDCAHDWATSLQDFQKLKSQNKTFAFFIKYEKLVYNMENELSPLLNALQLEFETSLISYENSKQPLFENPHGHLSADALKLGLQDGSIGKWKQILSPVEVREFESIAGDKLTSFGYELENS